jgi:hypothetical protein
MNEPSEEQVVTSRQVETIRKGEVVDVYVALLEKIWMRAINILGLVTIRAIFRRAVSVTARHYPLVGDLSVTKKGLEFEIFRDRMEAQEKEQIRQGFEELILNLFSLLAELTGEAIVNKLFTEDIPVGRRRR